MSWNELENDFEPKHEIPFNEQAHGGDEKNVKSMNWLNSKAPYEFYEGMKPNVSLYKGHWQIQREKIEGHGILEMKSCSFKLDKYNCS